jgi:hypothetical protein
MIVFLLCSIVFTPFIVYEGVRLYTHHQECSTSHAQNELLLKNPTCSDPWKRHAHGPKQQQACERAEAENLVSVMACAWQGMWMHGEAKRVWSMLTENYFMLASIVVPSVLLIIFLLFWSCNERATRRSMFDFQERMYKETLHLAHGREPLYVQHQQQHVPQQKKKREYIQLIR